MPARPIPAERFADLQDTGGGLSEAAAAEQRKRFGSNDIVVAAPTSWLDILRDTARDPMIWFLAGVSVLFAVLGDYTEALILAAALAPLIGMDAYLHRRTQASTQGLASRLATIAKVFRDRGAVPMPARDVVPGDLVEVGSGEPFPADGLLVSGEGLQVDESSLTGESHPARKQPIAGAWKSLRSADIGHWAFAGTRLLTGTAHVRIVATGGETLYGEIVRSALLGRHVRTPLQQAVGRLVTLMLVAALVLCAVLAAIRLVQGHGLVDAFLSAVTLAIAALPEEFPVVLTFFLGVGVYRLARRQALVRRAVAVENIGRVTCICSDKTGTLTEGSLALAHSMPVEGTAVQQVAGYAAMAARAESGDPLDLALLAGAKAAPARCLATFPFTEDRRHETAIVLLPDGGTLAVVKGAPETVLAMCADAAGAAAAWREHVAAYASTGHKVIAVATKPLPSGGALTVEPGDGFTLRGILAFEDPVREGVREAVTTCNAAGIRIIMITGDHPATAAAIGRDVGLHGGHPVVALAEALDPLGNGPTPEALRGIDVVARAAPGQKLRLVQALQKAGEIVAVTGDGVNDVPALQTADIGIAMGERGTQSAREVAAIVLLDDNFRTIVRAIAEGRQLFMNLRLAFAYLLIVHVPLVLSAAAVPLADNPLLYLPIHIVWLELIIHPTALLAFQDLHVSKHLMPVEPGGPARFFSRRAWAAILVSGLLLAVVIFAGFEYALGLGNDVEHARSIALGALIGASAAATAALTRLATWASRIVVAGELASLVLFVQVPVFAGLVHLKPLHAGDWGLAVLASALAGALAMVVRSTIGRRARA